MSLLTNTHFKREKQMTIETEFNNVLHNLIDKIACAVVMKLDIREKDLKREEEEYNKVKNICTQKYLKEMLDEEIQIRQGDFTKTYGTLLAFNDHSICIKTHTGIIRIYQLKDINLEDE